MYRNILLEFLSTKHLELNKNNYFQMTICQLGQSFNNQMVKLVKKEDLISVYHIKEPRIYQKDLSFDDLTDNIVMMAVELKEEIKFNKNELNYKLNDPFYLKDLQNQDFKSLQVTPIIENDNVIGVIITYYNNENGYIKCTNNELLKLFNNLTSDLCVEFEKKVIKSLELNNEILLLVTNNKQYYLNSSLQNYLKLKEDIINYSDSSKKNVIDSFINLLGVKKGTYENLNLYYLPKSKLEVEKTNVEILALRNINNHNFDEHFSYIFVHKNHFTSTTCLQDSLFEIVQKLSFKKYKMYEYDEDTLIMLVESTISNKDIEKIKNLFIEDYIIILQGSNDITKNMNLQQLSNYLFNIQPNVFELNQYIDWLNKFKREKLTYDDKFKDNKFIYEIVSSENEKKLCELSYLPLRINLRTTHYNTYQLAVEREISLALKQMENKLFISIPFSLLKKRKTYENVKKIIQNNELWINVITDDLANSEEFMKLIAKYKKLNIMLCCDSSVYLNYFYMNSLSLFDALYIQSSEYEHLRVQEVGLPQLIFDYAIKNYKYLIFENFNPNRYDFNHFNCYYVKMKNKIN